MKRYTHSLALVAILSLLAFTTFHLSGQSSDTAKLQAKSVPKTGVHFVTSNAPLQKLFDAAEQKAKWNITDFGKYRVLVEGAGYANVWLETQPMGGYMYGKRDLQIARNNIELFMNYQREDGRLPGMLSFRDGVITAHYGWFQGYCFPGPAFELYFLLNHDKAYLNRLYTALEKFDDFLWRTRDSDHNGCLETWCLWDTGEDMCVRYGEGPHSWSLDEPPSEERIRNMSETELKSITSKSKYDFSKGFPVPMESMDIMSYSYTGRDILAKISKELGNSKETAWRTKANEVQAKLKSYLWDEKRHACYDRDKDNRIMNILIHNNLRCMYFGSFDQQMADDFVKYHLMNPKEFWTPMPLVSIAVNDSAFRNIPGNNWSGQPQGLTFQRSITAMENYGHFAELTLIGQKFLKAVGDSLKFTQQFDSFTGTINHSKDGYGPSILTSLEFISRMYGIHLTQDRVCWSCLKDANQYEYEQVWGDSVFLMKTVGNNVSCSINGTEVFSFTKGIRVISDLSGKILELNGIAPTAQQTEIRWQGKLFNVAVSPNGIYSFDGKFHKTKQVEFCKPPQN